MIEVKNITKKYGKAVAVDNISFNIEDGEIVGLLGPNGAGKSTTMNIITGFIEQTEGDVIIDGYNTLKKPKKAKKEIGYMPEGVPLYTDLTVKEFVSYMAEIKQVNKKERKEKVEKIIEKTGLKDVEKKLIKKGFEVTKESMEKNIHDIIGVRIVCSFLSDVTDIVTMIQNSREIRIIDKKDYIANPKDSGYSSYHLIVLIPIYLASGVKYMEAEIQIRTVAMDFWASLDHKMRYKFPGVIPEEIQKEIYWCSQYVKMLDQKMLAVNETLKKSHEQER